MSLGEKGRLRRAKLVLPVMTHKASTAERRVNLV
jgi:hypothetical protein